MHSTRAGAPPHQSFCRGHCRDNFYFFCHGNGRGKSANEAKRAQWVHRISQMELRAEIIDADVARLLVLWNDPNYVRAGPSFFLTGTVSWMSVLRSGSVIYRLLCMHECSGKICMLEDIVHVSAAHQYPGITIMDRVVVEACDEKTGKKVRVKVRSMRRVAPWTNLIELERLAAARFLPAEHKLGPVHTIYSGSFIKAVCHTTPTFGLHRLAFWDSTSVTCVNPKTQGEERHISISFKQRQWEYKSEAREDPDPVSLTMSIDEDQCRQLPGNGLTGNLDEWKAIMTVNHIPFYALVAAKDDKISLSTLAVQWDLVTYLETRCVKIPVEVMCQLVPGSSSTLALEGEVINISHLGAVPLGPQWHYYAMTADPAQIKTTRQVAEAKCARLFFAVRRTTTEQPSLKKAKTATSTAGVK